MLIKYSSSSVNATGSGVEKEKTEYSSSLVNATRYVG